MNNDINFVERNSETIENEMINLFESYTGETLPLGDVRRQFIQGMAYVVTMLVNGINTTGRNNLLRYAHNEFLDGLGEELYGVHRLTAAPATVDLKFTLSNAQATDIEIPKGTRVTADGKIYFALIL